MQEPSKILYCMVSRIVFSWCVSTHHIFLFQLSSPGLGIFSLSEKWRIVHFKKLVSVLW